MASISANVSEPRVFQTSEGRLAYEDSASGTKAVICLPGLGDTRGQYRLLAPLLVSHGFRAIVLDPRGQGDSEANFNAYSSRLVGADLVALIDQLNCEVRLIGNSSAAASVAWAAAERPEKVRSMALLGPFLRDHPMGLLPKLGLSLALRGPWAAPSWIAYYKGLFATNAPADQGAYLEAMASSLKKPGHARALRSMVFASKSDVTARLPNIKQKTLILMGARDPDFKNPEEEVHWIQTQLQAEKRMIEGAGHYPHLEFPEEVAEAIGGFFNRN